MGWLDHAAAKLRFKRNGEPCYTTTMTQRIAISCEQSANHARAAHFAPLLSLLGQRSIVLVGLMGSGKTSAGRRLAQELGMPFIDSDAEIEAAAGMSISDIFAQHGESYFRDGERRVIARLLTQGPRVVATGGGAFMDPQTRARIASSGVSVWLKADHDVLWRRVRKRAHRPLLQGDGAEQTLRRLIDERYPVYAEADVTVVSRDGLHESTVEDIIASLERLLRPPSSAAWPPKHSHAAVVPETWAAESISALQDPEVRVDLGERSYSILIGAGLVARAGELIRSVAPQAACAIVTDENVAKLHLAALETSLQEASIRHSNVIVPPGEGSKSIEVYAHVCDALIGARLERGDITIALGGGVVGDLAGFAAATVRRGMRFIQVPTTFLAQVDSSVGGKTGINSSLGKNLIGAFHQPSLVIADATTLDTLPEREFRAGYAEVVKYGLIKDAGLFDWLERNWREIFSGGTARVQAIAASCRAKAAIVGRDEREEGERALLNLGHTFGHALERIAGYDGEKLIHGEAVAIGIACAFRYSERRGFCPATDRARVEAHLTEAGLPIRITAIRGCKTSADAVLDAMYQDKKVSRGALTFILARGIGNCFIARSVEAAEIRSFLQDELNPGQ